jgi:hypothetical protein
MIKSMFNLAIFKNQSLNVDHKHQNISIETKTRVSDYGHRIRLKYGVFTAVNGQIQAVYMLYFTVIQVYVYDRIHTVSYTACLRLKSDDRI